MIYEKLCGSAHHATITTHVPFWNLSSHFSLLLHLPPTTVCVHGSTLRSATGLFRASGMSALQNLFECRLTTCGNPLPFPRHHHQPLPSAPFYNMGPAYSNTLGSMWRAQMCNQNIPMPVHICWHPPFPAPFTFGFGMFLFLTACLNYEQ